MNGGGGTTNGAIIRRIRRGEPRVECKATMTNLEDSGFMEQCCEIFRPQKCCFHMRVLTKCKTP